ncbi:MAG TPA: DUF1553 domain-containing protein, partial [Candidatus Eisenbacteria bacterium]|nr:DUF1553 domain-containing protein [Candidatus Eisenbacteria bacterium]
LRRFLASGPVGSLAVILLFTTAAGVLGANLRQPSTAKVDFNRDIRPIFSDICSACHGPDDNKRKAGLRLDVKESAFKPTKSGAVPIVPGDTKNSELLKRVTSTDDDERMPPPKSGKKLTTAQIDLLRRWIEQGAEYKSHWAFIAPERPDFPAVKNKSWPCNGVDYFILARLEQEGLKPSGEADKATLIRRVTLDLTGLPPTPAEVDAFLADKSADAYEKLVDRLLDSARYGERMTLEWMDAARYADTHGYHIDSARDMTHWRDGVIESFNRNEPFDQFTIEQLAGDLLPNATREQKIASGFNRNNMINYEGGAIAEEYLTAYLVDRVNTTATVWLGLTMACAQCHDHKYDPLTMKEYYRFYAFFNNVPEKGLDGRDGNAAPVVKVSTDEQQDKLEKLQTTVHTVEAELKTIESELPALQSKWEQEILAKPAATNEPAGLLLKFALDESLAGWSPTFSLQSLGNSDSNKLKLELQRETNAPGTTVKATLQSQAEPKWVAGKIGKGLQLDGKEQSFVSAGEPVNFERTNAFSCGCWVKNSGKGTGALLAKMDDGQALRGFDLLLGDGKLHLHLIHSWPDNALRVVAKKPIPKDTWTHVFATYDGSSKASGVKLYVNGREVPVEVTNDNLSDSILNQTSLNLGKRSVSHPLKGTLDDVSIYDRVLEPDEIASLFDAPALTLVRLPADERTDDQKKELREHFRDYHAPQWAKAKDELASAKKARDDFDKTIPTAMVMGEQEKPRETFMLVRGQYDKKGESVTPGTPAALPPLPQGAPTNRLGLARWLVAPDQPLTARVVVNRYWQMYFGNGIVKTAENFGSQSDWPTHPDLLDWLATEFVRTGWDVKGMQKLIVTSATYRQSSVVRKEVLERDPENRLLARGPRLRLPAEFIRDQALAVSGLLNSKIGGASVNPYQPAGLWEELMSREDGDNFTAQKYQQDHGIDLYRRSMYTFWKRTSPHPTLATLDVPDRQMCVVRRPRTNTPLQALLLMNDTTYVEAARKLAERMMTEAKDDKQRIAFAYRLTMARTPKSAETEVLLKLYRNQLASYRRDSKTATKLLRVGESAINSKLDPAELAAWTMVANAILNLDETITKG